MDLFPTKEQPPAADHWHTWYTYMRWTRVTKPLHLLEAAAALGVSSNTLSRIERGLELPIEDLVPRWCSLMGVAEPRVPIPTRKRIGNRRPTGPKGQKFPGQVRGARAAPDQSMSLLAVQRTLKPWKVKRPVHLTPTPEAGARLVALRIAKLLTQRELARAAGITIRSLCYAEIGRAPLYPDQLAKVLSVLGVNPDGVDLPTRPRSSHSIRAISGLQTSQPAEGTLVPPKRLFFSLRPSAPAAFLRPTAVPQVTRASQIEELAKALANPRLTDDEVCQIVSEALTRVRETLLS